MRVIIQQGLESQLNQSFDNGSSLYKRGPVFFLRAFFLFIAWLTVGSWLSVGISHAAPRIVSLEHRIEGVLLGQALGDAWGAPYEMYKPLQIKAVFGGVSRGILPALPTNEIFRVKGQDQWFWLRRPGFYTDDTQQSLGLLTVIFNEQKDSLSRQCWGPTHNQRWAKLIVDGFRTEAWRGYGKKFKNAADQLANTVSAKGQYNVLVGTPSAGVGAAMRVAPLGALYFELEQEPCLRQAVMESSLLTHRDMRAAATAYAVAYVTAALIRGESVENIAHQLPFAIERAEIEYGERATSPWAKSGVLDAQSIFATNIQLAKFLNLLKKQTQNWTNTGTQKADLNLISAAVRKVASESLLAPVENQSHIISAQEISAQEMSANDPYSFASGFHAIGLALVAVNAANHGAKVDPLAVMAHAISQGSDADTVAAMLGAMLGSRFGVRWIQKTGAHKILPASVGHYAKMMKAFRKGFVSDKLNISYDSFLANEAILTGQEKEYQQRSLRAFQQCDRC
jgi:ADP-ribosyl-[dinitrogen reductase] hydrolase